MICTVSELSFQKMSILYEINYEIGDALDNTLISIGDHCSKEELHVSSAKCELFQPIHGMYEPKVLCLKRQKYTIYTRFTWTKSKTIEPTIILAIKEVTGATLFLLSIEGNKLYLKREMFGPNEDNEIVDLDCMIVEELLDLFGMEKCELTIQFVLSEEHGCIYIYNNGVFLFSIIEGNCSKQHVPASVQFGAVSINPVRLRMEFEKYILYENFVDAWQNEVEHLTTIEIPDCYITKSNAWLDAKKSWCDNQVGTITLAGNKTYKIFDSIDADQIGVLVIDKQVYHVSE